MKSYIPFTFCICALLLLTSQGVLGTTFTFVNRCNYTVWPAIRGTHPGSSSFPSTGFELSKGTSRSFEAPRQWSGQFWGRTGCNFDPSGYRSCVTGDCGSGRVDCQGKSGAPPITLLEFALGQFDGLDYYDTSLVDGFNLPIKVEADGGSDFCESIGCMLDLNRICPEELKMGSHGCMAPCQAFGGAEYCCTGSYANSPECKPNVYAEMFKAACPTSYSYIFDDATSTFTCSNANFRVTFCPYSSFSSL